MRTFSRKGVGSVVPASMIERLGNPILFKGLGADLVHGYEGTTLIEICDLLWEARKQLGCKARKAGYGGKWWVSLPASGNGANGAA